jgi:hypothetical protein
MFRSRIYLAFVALSLLVGCAAGPEKTVQSFYRAIEKGDTKAAVDLLSAGLVAMVGRPKLEEGIRRQALEIQRKGGIKTIETVVKSKLKDAAEVHVTIVLGNGEKKEEDIGLAREEGKWKVSPKK